MTNWKRKIEYASVGDDIIFCTLSPDELVRPFCDEEFRGTEGIGFTAWSVRYVYFPACYDDCIWVDRAPRNPCDEITPCVGGG